ncbi:hypothetical protein M0804_007758 [Polistes exclamans]|nr:hypothetical protein M0804_007758 [Polistes exclamans]
MRMDDVRRSDRNGLPFGDDRSLVRAKKGVKIEQDTAGGLVHSTVQHITAQHSIAQHSTAQNTEHSFSSDGKKVAQIWIHFTKYLIIREFDLDGALK